MILQALAKYYDRMIEDGVSNVEPEGFKRVAIPFIIVLKKDGSLSGIDDTRSSKRSKQAQPYIVPRIFEGSRTVNVKANLLWDKASYVFGVSQEEVDKRSGDKREKFINRLKNQREKFLTTINDYFPNQDDDGARAVVKFLEVHADSIQKNREWEEIKSKDPNIAFRFEDEYMLICNRDTVKEAIANKNKTVASERGLCLVTGKFDNLTPLENPIKGLRGSGKGESHLVSFNESAYWSYGKGGKKFRHKNAQVSKSASSAYVTAINYMQRDNSKQWLKIGDATTVFWAEKKHEIEDCFTDIFGEPAKGESEQDNAAIRALFESMKTGAPPVEWDLNHFYVLGLAPNSARIAVRFWYAGSVAQAATNILQHFADISITHAQHQPEYLSLFHLLVSTASQRKSDNIQPNLAGDCMMAVLSGTPYPRTLLSSTISRIKAEQAKKDKSGKSMLNVTYERAALIKAVLVRNARYYKKNKKEEITMSLDTGNTNPGYMLGRLFAVLEKIQEEAAKPNKINATIRDRFYGSASSTPVVAFSHLMKLKNHHLSKMENYKGYYERLIGEIMCKIDANRPFPANLSLDDQGRFAVGYYHQRFCKKQDDNK